MHNAILIMVSSKWSSFFFRELFIMSHFSIWDASSFLFWSSKFPHYLVAKLHLNHRKASPSVLNFSFFLSSFYYRSFSWRLYMVLRQGFLSFFNCSSRFLSESRSVKLYSKINMVLNTCFVLRSSSILQLLRWCCVIFDNFPSCFMIHNFSRVTYFKPIIFNSFMRSFANH